MSDESSEAALTSNEKWAQLRLALGLTQMVGAACAFYFIAVSGVSQTSLYFVVGTSVATTLSVMLFGRGRPSKN